jgi:Uma2 family endonuclease
MKAHAKRPATYQDLAALPDHLLGQLVDGELVASPRPGLPHSRAASVLGMQLGGPFDAGGGGPGGWWLLFEPELHLGPDVLVPDFAGWRRERLPRLPSDPFLKLAPDWLCEVLSPGTEALDRVRKMRVYARERVPHIWLINPQEQLLEVYRLSADQFLLLGTYEGADRVRAEPFESHELELQRLWIG